MAVCAGADTGMTDDADALTAALVSLTAGAEAAAEESTAVLRAAVDASAVSPMLVEDAAVESANGASDVEGCVDRSVADGSGMVVAGDVGSVVGSVTGVSGVVPVPSSTPGGSDVPVSSPVRVSSSSSDGSVPALLPGSCSVDVSSPGVVPPVVSEPPDSVPSESSDDVAPEDVDGVVAEAPPSLDPLPDPDTPAVVLLPELPPVDDDVE